PLELHQFKLIFAAFAVRALHVVLMFSPTWSFEAFARGDLDWGVGTVIGLAGPLAGLSAVTASVVLLVRSRRNRRSEVRGAAGFVLVFCLVGFAEYAVVQAMRLLEFGLTSYIYSPFQQLDLMVLRPALVFYAMLRHDLVGRIRHARPLGLAAVAALAFASYSAGLVSSLGRAPGNSAFYLALSLAAAAGLTWATLAALGPSLDAPVAASRKASSALEAFTAAMEDAYRNGEPSREQRGILEARRRRLGVPREQAKALELAVQTRWAGTVDAAEWHAGETLRGRYRVERLLGEGGGGAAYLATDLLESRPVVLKRTHRLDEPAQKAFLREAFLLARLNHPRIVRLLRSETLGRETILVLDYAAGGSLATRLARKPLSDAEAVRLAHDVLDAMRTAHEAGIVHRDIKPSNILLDAQGRAMLSDFGVARENRGAPDLVTHTATSDRPPGSLHYMSPEQVQGFPVDARSDLYSFGVVLAEAVGGSPHPTHPTTDYEIRRAIVEGPAPRLPLRVSGRLATAIQAATRKEPAQRVGSARDLALLLGPSTMKKKQQAPAHAEHIARRQGT
ncbi:MAG TPA: serine/threonine-protein kinase, partial [Candidatus Thermoplasmatota archaeon]|nr:serine/threonine-protein kinase [Candidatus Thermoplasmatota archaeon]